MKEITRIHIAKVPYDAELEAKKELEKYLKALEAYSGDADIAADIEIRMTEILEERGTKKGGVVTLDDVKALRRQLGEPRDFADENDSVVKDEQEKAGVGAPRKLFRDTDRAVLGGVLSGIAGFFDVNPVVVRIVFIILAFVSFGTALLVYVILWLAVPPARTAADKLQLAGRAVTLSSIRELNESEALRPPLDNAKLRRTAFAMLGAFSALAALTLAGITVVASIAALFGRWHYVLNAGDSSGLLVAAFVLMVICGALSVALFALLAYSCFIMRMTKRLGLIIGGVTITGILLFGTALGLVQYGSLQYRDTVRANTHETQLTLPVTASAIKSMSADSSTAGIRYIVTSGAPKAVVRTMDGVGVQPGDVSLAVDGATLKVKVAEPKTKGCEIFWCSNAEVMIYGPALDAIASTNNTDIDYAADRQDKLKVTAEDGAETVISKGTITLLTADAGSDSEVTASGATVSHADLTARKNATLELGVVTVLNVTAPTACPAGTPAYIEAVGVTSDELTLNGHKKPVASVQDPCMTLSIETEEEDER